MRFLVIAFAACGGGEGGPLDGQATGGVVGRVCDPGPVSPGETVVASPALDCESLMCLAIASSTPPMCTARCSADADCDEAAESACPSGFACAPVFSVGTLACEKLCVCSDRVPTTTCS